MIGELFAWLMSISTFSSLSASTDSINSNGSRVLSGTGADQIYIRVFGGIVPLSNNYYIDLENTDSGFSLKSRNGRIELGRNDSLSIDFRKWITEKNEGGDGFCGLNIYRINSDGVEVVLVNDEVNYMNSAGNHLTVGQ